MDALAEVVRELVRQSLHGDQDAMAQLVDRFRGQVFGLCYRMLGNRQDAEDMTQESFVRALRSLANWDSTRDFRPWLLAIAGNRCRTLLARRAKHPKQVQDFEALADRSGEVDEGGQLLEEIKLGLAALRAEYRRAFVLFHESQMSYLEIADVLDCPVGTVKTWVHRARRELAEHLRRRGVVGEASPSRDTAQERPSRGAAE